MHTFCTSHDSHAVVNVICNNPPSLYSIWNLFAHMYKYDQRDLDLIQRGESHSNPVHVINVDIKDNYEEAMVGGRMILHLAKDIEQARDLDEEIQPILDRFNQRYPSAPVLHSVSYF